MSVVRVGFKNGADIKVDVLDAKKFMLDIAEIIKRCSPISTQWYADLGFMFMVNDVVFMVQETH